MIQKRKLFVELRGDDGRAISEPAEAGKFRRVGEQLINSTPITFPAPSGPSTITRFAIYTKKGGQLADGPLVVPIVVDQFTQPSFPEGALSIDGLIDDFFDIEEDEDPCEPICRCRYCGGTARDTLDRCVGCGAPY